MPKESVGRRTSADQSREGGWRRDRNLLVIYNEGWYPNARRRSVLIT